MDWQNNFDPQVLKRGSRLQKANCVKDLEFDDDDLFMDAFIEDPWTGFGYYVSVKFYAVNHDRYKMQVNCDCIESGNCSHAAAVIMEHIARTTVRNSEIVMQESRRMEDWLASFAEAGQKMNVPAEQTEKKSSQFLVYVLQISPYQARYPVFITFFMVRHLKKGGWGKPQRAVQEVSTLLSKEYVSEEDRRILAELFMLCPKNNFKEVALNSEKAVAWLENVLDKGRCCWKEARESQVLSRGDVRNAELGWRVDDNGLQKPALIFSGEECIVLPFEAPCYVDEDSMKLGRLEFGVPPDAVMQWLQGDPIEPDQVPAMMDAMKKVLPEDVTVRPPREIQSQNVKTKPVPCLTFYTSFSDEWLFHYFQTGAENDIHAVKLEFQYENVRIDANDYRDNTMLWNGEVLVCVERDMDAEEDIYETLAGLGFKEVRKACHWIASQDPIASRLTLSGKGEFLQFMAYDVPELERKGWIMEFDPSFELNLVEPESWYVNLEESSSSNRWFDAELGVVVDGKQENLLPLLIEFIRNSSRSALRGRMEEDVIFELSDGRSINLPAERLRTLTSTLVEIFGKKPLSKEKKLGVPWIRALELLRLENLQDLESNLPEALNMNLDRFRQLNEPPSAKLPDGLRADLRTYQVHGINWLQLLRELNLGAVLADDMGLGKTVQALAHILIEKESGRMDAPCLVVAPTSVLYNWEEETRRFAPDLKVHVSHGPERKEFFDTFSQYDIIVTSYPLLVRDAKCFTDRFFHLTILDEAQFVRNHKTQAARIARLLNTSQRIALTGTPLENNLDELWSLFSYAVPGLLGENALFRQLFRNPIEKDGNKDARRLLARRIAPFILRRTKDEVMKELPRKTEIVQRVDLLPKQKDLYETVRVSVEKKVRESIKEKGLARSHIIFLDALLKMRQVCCHPQLLKLKAAQGIVESAKLDTLREMVVEMVAEGRRILLFSQFVSMIKLIEAMLAEEKIAYAKITGQTRKRQKQIEEFQAGKAPVFLISLKAGGTGLNLTAADTVIHYDPWWNPAVENQATDRAHRIGQDKPVFVYKLIAAGTVEEKILELQAKKSELVNGLLDDQKESLKKWGEADIEAFLAPLAENPQ